jgi:hypothetical protein
VLVGGTGVLVGGTGVLVGGTGVLVGSAVAVGGTGVLVGSAVAVGGTGVLVAVFVAVGGTDVLVGSAVAVGGTGMLVGRTGVGVPSSGRQTSRSTQALERLAALVAPAKPVRAWSALARVKLAWSVVSVASVPVALLLITTP